MSKIENGYDLTGKVVIVTGSGRGLGKPMPGGWPNVAPRSW